MMAPKESQKQLIEDEIDIPQWLAVSVLGLFFIVLWYIGIRHYIFAGATHGADNSSHLAEIVKIATILREGRFDFWFDQTNMGYPLFTGYNILPYVLMGGLVALTKSIWDPMHVYNASIIFFWSLIPICWYIAARLFELRRLPALIFALMPITFSEYTHFGLTISSVMTMGLYTHLWAIPLFPLVLACYYRFLILQRKGSMLAVILSHSILCSVHNLLGFLTGFGSLLFVIMHRKYWRRYILSQLVILLLFSYWLVSYLVDKEFMVQIMFTNHPIYGPDVKRFVDYLIEGHFFDHERLQVLTIFLFVGLIVICRSQNLLRSWAFYFLLFGVVMLLFAPGDSLIGKAIPFLREIPFRRYIAIIHVSGALLIAWGATLIILQAARFITSVIGISTAVLARDLVIILALLFAYERYFHLLKQFRNLTIDRDFLKTAILLQEENTARFLAHWRFRTTSHFFRNFLPMMADRPQLNSYARGNRDTISFYYTDVFNFSPAAYKMFNIRHLVAATDVHRNLRRDFSLQAQHGKIRIYKAKDEYSNFDVIRAGFAVTSFTAKQAVDYLRRNSVYFYYQRKLPLLTRHPPADMPYVAFTEDKTTFHIFRNNAAVEVDRKQFMTQMFAGNTRVDGQVVELKTEHGYRATASLPEPAYLLLKASYHPGWRAHVDGKETEIKAVAPNFMAVHLPSGQSDVYFTYHSRHLPQILFLLNILILVTMGGYLISSYFSSRRLAKA